LIKKSFDLPDERIDEIAATAEKTISYINTIANFSIWVIANLWRLDIEEINTLYEDFLKSNEHIIEKIDKIKHSSAPPDSAPSPIPRPLPAPQ
jgi:hypothetical protein